MHIKSVPRNGTLHLIITCGYRTLEHARSRNGYNLRAGAFERLVEMLHELVRLAQAGEHSIDTVNSTRGVAGEFTVFNKRYHNFHSIHKYLAGGVITPAYIV